MPFPDHLCLYDIDKCGRQCRRIECLVPRHSERVGPFPLSLQTAGIAELAIQSPLRSILGVTFHTLPRANGFGSVQCVANRKLDENESNFIIHGLTVRPKILLVNVLVFKRFKCAQGNADGQATPVHVHSVCHNTGIARLLFRLCYAPSATQRTGPRTFCERGRESLSCHSVF